METQQTAWGRELWLHIGSEGKITVGLWVW
jgi:hypothetical protein